MKNVLVGQSGGPTAVINSSLAGVYETAKACGAEHVYGMQYGIAGVLDYSAQLDEGVREGWITVEERKQLEELRAITLDTITVDDFDVHELRAASYYDLPQTQRQPREAA